MKRAILAVLACLVLTHGLHAEESREAYEKRMQWFDDAKFGLFIHWGAYSTLGGVYQGQSKGNYAEWIQANADIPKAEYEEVTRQFKPDQFDANQWIATAKKAGMKYMVITTKHHDGFCLWDSAHTTYDIKGMGGIEQDFLGELSKACRRHDLVFGTYYSIIDWHHPTQMPNPNGKGGWGKYGNCVLSGPDAKPEYVTYMKNQCKELIDRYDTQILWFDGDWNPFWTMKDGMDLYTYLRDEQPSAIINNRVAKRDHFKKDFGTPEQFTPGRKLDYYWEACWTINHSWGFKIHDTKWKSTTQLLHELVDIVSKGGNYLLNVGPKPDGTWPEACTDRLLAMGEWLEVNGDAIYKTRFSGLPLQSWGRTTRKGNTFYLHVFDWPRDGKLVLEGFTCEPSRVRLWGEAPQKVQVQSAKRSMTLLLPETAPQAHVNVIELVTRDGQVTMHATIAGVAIQDDDVILAARAATIAGKGQLRYEGKHRNLGYWDSTENTATWTVSVPAGAYDVLVVSAAPHEGGTYEIRGGGRTLSGTVPRTGDWQEYTTQTAGTLTFDVDGEQSIVIQAKEITNNALFNLRGLVLRPRA